MSEYSKNYDIIAEQVNPSTPESVISATATLLDRAEEAAERIKVEGLVVRDMRGSVIEHPAITIEKNAIRMYTDLIKKWTP